MTAHARRGRPSKLPTCFQEVEARFEAAEARGVEERGYAAAFIDLHLWGGDKTEHEIAGRLADAMLGRVGVRDWRASVRARMVAYRRAGYDVKRSGTVAVLGRKP